jgi:hypothetical protein
VHFQIRNAQRLAWQFCNSNKPKACCASKNAYFATNFSLLTTLGNKKQGKNKLQAKKRALNIQAPARIGA